MRFALGIVLLLAGCAPAALVRPPERASVSDATERASSLRLRGALQLRAGHLDAALAHLDASRTLHDDPRTVALMVEAHVRAGRLLEAGELCTDVNIVHPALDVICGVAALHAGEGSAVTAFAER